MDTDKNGWPYPLVLVAIILSLLGLFCNTHNAVILWFGCISYLWFWSCVALFLNLAFSKTLKPISLHKKLAFAFFPLMYLSLPWRFWFLTEIDPIVTYEQFVNKLKR